MLASSMCFEFDINVRTGAAELSKLRYSIHSAKVSLSEETLLDRPRHAVSATVSNDALLVLGDLVEERLGHVKIALGAADAAVPDGRLAGGAIGAGDVDGLAAEGVLVGVAVGRVLVEEVLADGDHLLALAGFVATGAHAGGEVGHLAGERLASGRVVAGAGGAGAVRCRRRAGGRGLVASDGCNIGG